MNANAFATRDMCESLANKGFSGPVHVCARVARARGATEMLDRKRWFLSDCQILLHYLGVSSTVEHVESCSTSSSQRVFMRRTSEQERRDCNPAAPARKTSSKVTASS